MDHNPERQDPAATAERRLLSLEEVLSLYSSHEIKGEFAGDALDNGAVKMNIDKLVYEHMKRGNDVVTTLCINTDDEIRYLVLVKERLTPLNNIIGGYALGQQPPHRY